MWVTKSRSFHQLPSSIFTHFSTSSRPPPSVRLSSSSSQTTGTASSWGSFSLPSSCSQRELSKVKWVHVLFFLKSLQCLPITCHPWGGIQGSSHTGPIPSLWLHSITLPLRTLCLWHQGFHCAINSSIPFHLWFFACAVSSDQNDILYLLCLENSFALRPIDGGYAGRMMPLKPGEEWILRRKLYWTLELAT